ncbi:MAG: glycosyltransferase family 4 protein [Bacilli bacterium]|nr:glycosyltransferase family 4 protein [Bacilli bacterium]
MIKKFLLKGSRYLLNQEADKALNRLLEEATFDPVNDERPHQVKSILFVIPTMLPNMGGLTSLLRVASACAKKGISVFYMDYYGADKQQQIDAAEYNLPGHGGIFLTSEEANNRHFDVVCASDWASVYYAKKIPGYHIWFVQDYEPYFFNYSDNYFLAKKAFDLGFHLISLGKWNLDQIEEKQRKKCKMDWIEFPFEPSEYPFKPRDFKQYQGKKEVSLAIYTKREAKRTPSLLQSMVFHAQQELAKKGITLIPYFFGLNQKEKVKVGTNLGRLSKQDLADLYHRCDFGLVFSLTNISLVPYEMLGCGLPVIEFADGSYPYFLGDDTAILVDLDYLQLAKAIEDCLNDPSGLEAMMEKAKKRIENLSWEKTKQAFVDFVLGLKE